MAGMMLALTAGLALGDVDVNINTGRVQSPPHVVVVVGDDLGTYDVHGYRGGRIPTPAMDALVADGLVMICAPTRSSLVSGRYPFHAAQSLPEGFHALSVDYKIIPQLPKEGPTPYRSYHTGKWHMGFFNNSYTPHGRGFDEAFSFLGAIHNVTHWNQWGGFCTTTACTGHDIWTSGPGHEGPAYNRTGTYSAELYSAATVGFVRSHAAAYPNTPMYLQAEFFVPHGPTDPGPPVRYMPDIATGLADRSRANYTGMVVALDSAVANLTAALRETGMWDQTLLVLFGDNGGAVPDGGRNWPLRGCKWTRWDGGTRQTAVWAGGALPAAARGVTTHALGHVSDVLPTVCQAAGIDPASLGRLNPDAPAPVDGVSLWTWLQNPGETPSPRTEVLIDGSGWSMGASLRQGGEKNRGGATTIVAPVCNSTAPKAPSGLAWHGYAAAVNFALPNTTRAAAAACAEACCHETAFNCSGWSLTRPKYDRAPCSAHQPCCTLLEGGTLGPSADPDAWSGASGLAPPAPGPPAPHGVLEGALRVGDWKIIATKGEKYPSWYAAPEDQANNSTMLAMARSFCRIKSEDPFPPAKTPSCAPHCLFNLAEDPCETHDLSQENVSGAAAMLARLAELSAHPVPFDSCLPDCTAENACSVSRTHYSGFFGPYHPPL